MTKLINLPEALFRAFKEEKYAIEFIDKGEFRFGELAYYRDIEDDARRDDSEGYGRYFDHQNIQYDFELGNPIYLFPCAVPDVDLKYLRARFGQFIVRINDPQLFVQQTEAYLATQGVHTFNGIHGNTVKYTKGTKFDQELDSTQRVKLSLIQKPSGYHRESEYRLFTILKHDSECPPQAFLKINLGQSLRYAEMLP